MNANSYTLLFLKAMAASLSVPSETSALEVRISDSCGDSPVAQWVKPGNKPQNLMRALCCTVSSIIAVIWRETDWKSKNQEKVKPRKDSPSWTLSWAHCRNTNTFSPHNQEFGLVSHTALRVRELALEGGRTHLNTLSILLPPSLVAPCQPHW